MSDVIKYIEKSVNIVGTTNLDFLPFQKRFIEAMENGEKPMFMPQLRINPYLQFEENIRLIEREQ